MSPSRSKSKDKRVAGKEPPKSSAKPTTANTGGGGGVPASGYNPVLGTFHTLETAPVSSVQTVHVNGRFRDIDDTDDPSGNSIGTTAEYDCVSNNGSWSGESEDPKDKPSQLPSRHETNSGVDNDKREKIRQKNEKKHQRQKERRAQELHERCCGYLMSRKLEALAQQLVAMGFPSERATMALIMNEGKLEESVAWLFESGEDSGNNPSGEHNNLDSSGGNLKVDISQELAQIADMEVKFKCSKQEVERAIVACEGDLEQATENLSKVQKQESSASMPRTEESNGKPLVGVSQLSSTSKVQPKRTSSSGAMLPIQQKPDDKDINYPNMVVTPGSKNIQLLKKVQPHSVASPSVEKRWAPGGLTPSLSYSLASPLQVAPTPPSKTETQYASVGNEFKNLQLREPVIMMQRPQSKHILTTTTTSASHVTDWNSNGVVEPVMGMNPNGFSHVSTTTRSFNTPSFGNGMSNQVYDQFHYQQHHQQQPLSQQHYGSQPVATSHMNSNNSNGMWNRMSGGTTTPTLAAASSLGLFSGLGSNGATGQAHDWNGGDWSSQFDYTNIDWSLNRLPSPASNTLRPNGMWMGMGSSPGKSVVRPTSGIIANGTSGMSIGGAGVAVGGGSETSGGGSREWASPFEEKDLFCLPRQFVSSPSL